MNNTSAAVPRVTISSAIFAVGLLLGTWSSIACFASAQDTATGDPRGTAEEPSRTSDEPSPELTLELDSIRSEAHWASGLWVTATAMHFTGFVGGVVSLSIAGGDPCDFSSTCTWIDPTLVSAAVTFGLGLLMFIPAIAVDLHARSRRRSALEPEVRLQAAPAWGGGILALSGSF